MIALKEQPPDQIVDVGPFLKEYYEVYQEGAREKASFVWPEKPAVPHSFCIPSRLYMFKLSRGVYPEQFWIEIFAYQLGCLIDVPVPPAFVAYDSENKQAGALIEWFYNQDEDLYLRGGDIMQSLIEDYDVEKGLKHNLQSIFAYLKSLNRGANNWMRAWVKMLTFDALLGNSDRHQGNWGIVTKKGLLPQGNDEGKEPMRMMSPAFDNGTSMGIEIQEKDFEKFNDSRHMERYLNKGKPHLKWDLNQDRKTRDNHESFIKKMIQAYPDYKEDMISGLQFSKTQVKEIFERLAGFEITPRFSKARAQFMLDLLFKRREQLLLALGIQS
ncbi:MAG: HipA domain-containing protein [Proteobacteria bacterium]|nr:HipA domain-containing protein [Pseudomonadota bacterium]